MILVSAIHLFATDTIDFIIAKVGREIILYSDLVKQINQMRSAGMYREEMEDLIILENMIENKLIIQKARDLNIRIEDRRIANAVENQFNTVKAQFRTEEEFFRELRNAGLLQSDLRKFYEEQFTEQFLRERLIQTEIRSKINLTDSDLLAFYHAEKDEFPLRDETFELAMILRIPGPSEETDRIARDKIDSIHNRIKNGEDFAQLAQEFSECPSAAVMGDLSYFGRGMMVPEFEDAAFRLNIDEVSNVVKTQFGYHIIKLTDRRNNEIRASHILVLLEETEADVTREQAQMQEILNRLRSGEDFAQLASTYSQDNDTKSNNGVIGALTRSEFPNFFVDELETLQPGEFSEVLEYQNMLYIFTINQAFEPRPYQFDEITEQLRDILTNQRQIELYEHWMENLKHEIFVQIYEDRLTRLMD